MIWKSDAWILPVLLPPKQCIVVLSLKCVRVLRCSWHRHLHILSPNYTSTLCITQTTQMTLFRLCDSDKRDSVLFFDAILFLTWPPCSKGTCARLWYARIKSCDSNAGFGTNIGSERIRNSLQLGENVRVEEASVWNFFRRRHSVSLQRLCCCN